ncbi:hypothetical protein [Pseudonocardia sp. Ae717_Ps2]|uniref:hypothetical protein n=1 Tax=Pseudonocardia sp. Ae717_Ps2 TaxID=1885573 RepID=UPI00094AD889|nr:hypothetical protein [Pseudonocardia sp. Ae717_Ps2]
MQLADMQARALLAEYETAIRGRKQLTWSLGSHDLRTGVDMEPEQSDEDIVAEDLEGEPVAVIPPHSWKIVEPRAAELLHITERAGDDAARAWLDDLGVEWWLPTGLTDTRRPASHPARRLTLPGVVFLRKTPNLLRRRRHRHPRRR